MRKFITLLILILTEQAFSASTQSETQKPSSYRPPAFDAAPEAVTQPKQTLAHTLLALELEGAEAPALWQKLNELIECAVANFGPPPPTEPEPVTARRFFRTVDEALIANGVIFPPSGSVELLRDALEPRHPSLVELQRALQDLANARRHQHINASRAAGDPLYYFDCDLAAIVYVAAAERLALPVYLVELPNHNFVRWQTASCSLNWDPNDGISKSDQLFAQVSGVTAEDRALFGYLENRTPARISSYWLVRRGQRKAGTGKFSAALADYRAAVKTSAEDFVAANELAWFLATSPEAAIRDGQEARIIAEKLVTRSRRISWLETLAAARAETGDFPQAVAAEEEARQKASAWRRSANAGESLTGFDACLNAYAENITYAAAVKSGAIK